MATAIEFFQDVCYFVEATSFEIQTLFDKHQKKTKMTLYPIGNSSTSFNIG